MKVHLLAGKHPIYLDLQEFPPKGVQYVAAGQKEELGRHYSKLNNTKKELIRLALAAIRMPRMAYFRTDADIIHSTRGILPLNKKLWVMDIEHVGSFVGFSYWQLNSKVTKGIIQRILASNDCKSILAHSRWSERGIRNVLDCKKFNSKLRTLYPAIKPCQIPKTKSRKFRLFFYGHNFYGKGGKEVLEAYKVLKKKYPNIALTVKSENLPEELVKKYKHVNFVSEMVHRDELFKKYFCNSDLLLLPSYIDTFGFVVLEAMSAGLPVITTDIAAFPELVKNGKTGFLIKSKLSCWDKDGMYKAISPKDLQGNKPEIVEQIVQKVSQLIDNPKLYRTMSKNAGKEVEEGRFSIKVRNEKLSQIYKEAISK